MRVLIVEDDSSIRRAIVDHFNNQGWSVRAATDGQLGLDIAINEGFDILVLDVMLPQVTGFEICRAVRQNGKDVPIVMLTAKTSEEDVLRGFGLGATDYVRKPFSLAELTVRVRLYSRVDEEDDFNFGVISLVRDTRQMKIGDKSLTLTEKEFSVLLMLLESAGRVLSRDQILNRVWGNSFMQSGRSVDRCIKTLRKKMAECSGAPKWIKTVRQVGYMYEVE